MPNLILIIGPPASGKTTLAKKLETQLGFPYFGMDYFKEALFDGMAIQDDETWSERLDDTSYLLLFKIAHSILGTGQSVMLESDFPEAQAQVMQKLIGETRPRVIQILLKVDHDTMMRRFKDRWENGERHPGQSDNLWVDELSKGATTGLSFFDVVSERIELDATTHTAQEHDRVIRRIEDILSSSTSKRF